MALDMSVALKINAGVTGQQAIEQLRTSMDRMKDTVDGVSNRFGLLKGAFAGLAGAAVVSGFVGMIRSAIDMGDKLNDLRQRTGLAVEDLDALGYAAELNGTNLDAVSGALGKLAKNMAEAAGGGKEAAAVFAQFGISQADLANGSITATDALAKIADKLSAMPDGWEKTAAAQKVFGKSAADLIPLLNAGGDAIRDARTELESMGALFTGSMAAAADEFNDNLSKLKRMAGALGLSIAQELMPVMNGFVLGIIDAKSQSDGLAGSTALSDWARVAAQGIAVLVDVARVAAQAIYALVGSFQSVWADITMVGTFLKDGPTALFKHGGVEGLQAALDKRNKVVEEANQRYVKLWNMDGSQVLNAVTSAIEKQTNAVKPLATGKPAKTSTFDFSAGKEGDYDKLLKQLNEELAKTGELTKSQELLNLFQTDRYKNLTAQQKAELLRVANVIEMTKQRSKDEQDLAQFQDAAAKARTQQLTTEWDAVSRMKDSKADELRMLQLEAASVNMSASEYDHRVRVLQHEQSVREATRNMLPETAAAYKEVANAAFQAAETQRMANEAQLGLQSAIDKVVVSKSDELQFLILEGQAVNMTTAEYEKRVRQLQNEFNIREATKNMGPAEAAQYREIAQAAFEAAERQRELNTAKSQMFETGAKNSLKNYAAELDNVAKSTEDAFSRAFKGMEDSLVNFIMTGKLEFKELARSILADMAKIMVQQMIMRPIMAMFGFADGGVMTSGGPLPLNTYANGGVANSPQVALFGEGRMPEAYVPLPDGRTIPVTMKGGAGGDTSVVVNVNMQTGQEQKQSDNQQGSNLGAVIANVVKQELINQRRPGGLLAA